MPFFPEDKIRKKIKNATLQVRILRAIKLFCEKRVLSSSLHYINLPLDGTLTVEAAFSLPLFLLAAISLMMPMRMMEEQRKIQAALESVTQEVSQYYYIQYRLNQGDEVQEAGFVNGWMGSVLSAIAVEEYARHQIMNKVNSGAVQEISFGSSSIMEDGETIKLVMRYRQMLPFPLFRIGSIPATAVSSRRAWIGADGGRRGGDLEGENIEDELVYIGRNKSRYHESRTCHYLYNDISTISYHQLDSYRNANGARYVPCSVCAKGANAESSIYIMPSGSSYHSNRFCSSIIAYVEAVPRTTVEYLGACSYCGKK